MNNEKSDIRFSHEEEEVQLQEGSPEELSNSVRISLFLQILMHVIAK